MTEDLLDYWQRIIKPFFPSNAWFVSRSSGGGYSMLIDWKLEDQPHKQNRRSRKIEIIIKEDVINDYLDNDKIARALYDAKMKEWISGRYHDFCLDQEADPSGSSAPVKWHISKNVFHP